MSPSGEKHVVFQEHGGEESDDDDTTSLEVTFDPSNPYRRKSSLVSSEAVKPTPQHRAKRDECIVHQFFESQRKAQGAAGGNGSTRYLAHQVYNQPEKQQQQGQANATELAKREATSTVEPKEKPAKSRCEVLADGHAGQSDQESWTSHMTQSMSETDLSASDDVHSRTLTKKQLSDMAWGVRELSRRLSSMRIRFRVKTVFLLTKVYDQDLIPKTRELTLWLLDRSRDVKYTVYIQDKLKNNKKFDVQGLMEAAAKSYVAAGEMDHEQAMDDIRRRLRYWDEPMCKSRPQTFDFVITLGGDGTVLYASWLFQRIVPPVLSFALGSLGFLTKFDFENFAPTLNSAFANGVTVSLRLRFEGTIMRSQRIAELEPASSSSEDEGKVRDLVEELIGEEREDARTHRPDGTFEILNEIVVDRGPNPTMSSTELFGDDEHFTSILADGICVSTPTGSTAYNLAAGGSLCHPENPVMLVTSICAHTLSFRPIIVPDTIVLRVGVPYDARTSSWASFDGRERVELRAGDYVTISASRYPFASVQSEGRRSEDWINSISGKLNWNTRQKQKSYTEWKS